MPEPRATDAPRTDRKHAPPEARRAQILEAALSCFAARGYHATTMDDIVAASGLSKGSLYWHFEGKEDVFLATFDYVFEQVFVRFDEAAAAGDADVVGLLEREMEHFFARFGDERLLVLAWVEFIGHPRGRERMATIYRAVRARLEDLIRAGIEAGQLRPVSPEGAAAALTGVLDALVLQAAIDEEFDLRAHSASVWELLHGGIAPAGTGTGAGRGGNP